MNEWRKRVIRVDSDRVAPTRVNSTAHAVQFGPLLFVTGQSGRRPDDLEYPADVAEQARQCLTNIGQVLDASGSSFANVLKRTVYVRDRSEYDLIRPVVEEYFVDPVASTIVVTGLLRDDVKVVEVEVIAAVQSGEASAAAAS